MNALEQAAESYSPNRETHHTLELEKAAFKAGAEWQKEQSKISALLSALKAIAMGAGNLPDDRLTSKTGPNDAALRGSMLIRMRQIAIDTVQLLEPDFKPLQD